MAIFYIFRYSRTPSILERVLSFRNVNRKSNNLRYYYDFYYVFNDRLTYSVQRYNVLYSSAFFTIHYYYTFIWFKKTTIEIHVLLFPCKTIVYINKWVIMCNVIIYRFVVNRRYALLLLLLLLLTNFASLVIF
jgi:hypothetical protein